LDIFSGAASVMIACDNTDRVFKGCELDDEYFELSLARYNTLTGKEFNLNLTNNTGQ